MAKKNRKDRVQDPHDRTLSEVSKRREKYARKAREKRGGELIKIGGAEEGIPLKGSDTYSSPKERSGGEKFKRKERHKEYFTTPFEQKSIAVDKAVADEDRSKYVTSNAPEEIGSGEKFFGKTSDVPTVGKGKLKGFISEKAPVNKEPNKMEFGASSVPESKEVQKGRLAMSVGFENPDVLRETRTKSKYKKGERTPYKRKTRTKTTEFFDKDYLKANKEDLEKRKTPFKDDRTGVKGYESSKVTRKGLVTKKVTNINKESRKGDGQYRQEGFDKRKRKKR